MVAPLNFSDKNKPQNMNKKIVYVVSGSKISSINERVQKLFMLKKQFGKMILICRGNNIFSDEVWEIKHDTNPTGFLSKLGLQSLKKSVDRWLYFPSAHILFINAIYKKLRKQIGVDIDQGGSVCLITCLPPHDLCLLGMKLKNEYPAMRWINDWQDLWSYDKYYLDRAPKIFRNRVLRTEKQAFEHCDMNVTTNPYARHVLIDRYGVAAKLCTSIYHPFSDGEVGASRVNQRYMRDKSKRALRVIFLGTLFKPPKVPGDKLINAMRYVRNRGIDAELHVYGSSIPDDIQVTVDRIEESGISFQGYLGHDEIISGIKE